MEEGETSAEESSVEIDSAKPAKSVIAQSSPAAKAAESASAPEPSKKDDGFTTVGRNGKRIAPIGIDAQSNATELLTQIGNLCSNTSLQGRFENGKLRVFPTSAEEHRIIQKVCLDKKCEFRLSRLINPPCPHSAIDAKNSFITLGFALEHRSVKCSGGHLTSECTKSAKAPAKCANCSGPHPANFSGCPKNPINTKTTKSKAAKNVWQELAAARKQNSNQSKPSFAEVVKGSKNNSLDAKEVMTKMAQMMSQWGDMLSLLQSKL
ncbi:nucleic-acid-binding protein from transposon X-element [Trichonephila clavipes]|uniref:Nucleic-acid-binding protein from transposon X-element n=1 Tax=Trichonephila clavipes TaxID=2585209 RepID=A0A8X7BIL2_TRICX|nr:nucleic-acid-binding protein from transposon X-element [Trichonephila clavipes]